MSPQVSTIAPRFRRQGHTHLYWLLERYQNREGTERRWLVHPDLAGCSAILIPEPDPAEVEWVET